MDLIEKLDKKVDSKLFDELESARTVVYGILRKISAQRLAQLKSEPKCPECGVGVLRPKCAFEMGADCPRHGVIEDLGGTNVVREHMEGLKNRRKKKVLGT